MTTETTGAAGPGREGGQKRGTLTGFRMRWTVKEPEEWDRVTVELLRSKVGRKARIRGTVETVAEPILTP